MTNQSQAEALRLADYLLRVVAPEHPESNGIEKAGAELRRLHARIAELEAQAQPAREPLTPDALADSCEAWLQAGGASNIVDAYEAGYRDCERDNGITKEKQG